VRALAQPNFRIYWSGQIVSLIGTWMQRTAQQWLVFRLTASPLDLGVVAFATFVPFLLFSPLAGLLVDRTDRRRLVLLTQVAFMTLGGLQAGLVFSGLIEYWHIVIIAFLLGLAETFEVPGRFALIGRVVPPADLLGAVALHSTAFNAARIVGPALAGLLLARVGEGAVFLGNAVSYVPVIVGLLFMRLAPGRVELSGGTALNDLREGVRFALGSRRVMTLTAIVTAQGLLALPYISVVPIFAGEILRAGPQGLGMLTAATGVGALFGAGLLMMLGDRVHHGRMLVLGMFGFAAALAIFAVSKSLPLSLAALTLLGLAQIVHLATSNTLIQLAAPDHVRGRVLGLYIWLFGGALPLGSLILGAASQQWGAPQAVLAAALLYAFVLCIIVFRRPDLARWE
jgi:MFS family permease